MNPINNSDTAWLVVADYNQENDKFHEELREDVLDPDVHQWIYEHGDTKKRSVGSYDTYCMVGEDLADIRVGIFGGAYVGDGGHFVGLGFNSACVGGNYDSN